MVDSGADTCLLGSEFHIENQDTMHTVEVLGFNDKCGKESGLHIGTRICAVDIMGGNSVLLQVNEGVVMHTGKSLLLCNQLRSFGTQVHDTPIIYGRLQCLILHDGTCLPLNYQGALTNLVICKPTSDKLATIEPMNVTSPVPWDPHQPYSLDNELQDSVDHDGLAAQPDPAQGLPARGGVSLSNTMIVSDEEADNDATVEVPHHKVANKHCKSKAKKQCTATTCPTQVKEEDRD